MKQIQLNVIFSTSIFWLIVDPYKMNTNKNEQQIIILEKTFGEQNSLEHSRPWSDNEIY